MYANIKITVDFLNDNGINSATIGIVLGTGLGKLINHIEIEKEILYENIPNFPLSTVESHHGKLIFGKLEGKSVIALQGRFHYYEGYTMQEVVYPIRVLKLLGIKHLILSNAAGAVNLNFNKGDLMLIDDHINLQPENPLRGKNIDELGSRFPDMSIPYDKRMNTILKKVASNENIVLNEGVYASVLGPNLETRAEYRFLKIIGADAVGMSTVPEVIAANHMNLPCIAISVLTDECDPDNLTSVSLAEILEVAGKAEIKLVTLIKGLIRELTI